MFFDDPHTIRYGIGENFYGYAEIKAFRAARSPAGFARTAERMVITTYGMDFAPRARCFAAPRAGRAADVNLAAHVGRLEGGRRPRVGHRRTGVGRSSARPSIFDAVTDRRAILRLQQRLVGPPALFGRAGMSKSRPGAVLKG